MIGVGLGIIIGLMKPFLLLQLRPENEASDEEYESIQKAGGLKPDQIHRVRMEQDGIPTVNLDDYSAVIVGGGPTCVSSAKKTYAEKKFEKQLLGLLRNIVEKDFPYLGACYGLGILAKFLGGKVSTEKYAEPVAAVTIKLTDAAKDDPILSDLPREFRAIGGHMESCQNLPPHSIHLAISDACPIHMIRVKKNIYATQFHSELDPEATAIRIRVYRHHGYFKPEEAEKLITEVMQETLTVPGMILERFVHRYKKFI